MKIYIFRSQWILMSAATALFLSSVGCTKKNSGSLEYGLNAKDTLRVNLQTEPPTLDWSKANDTTSNMVLLNIMDGLVDHNLHDPDLSLIPALATEWVPSQNARVWTFKIRKGVQWTDGVEFTAQHVVDGWERLLNPKTAAEYAYFLFPVKNAKLYNSGKISDFNEVGIKINKEGNLVVELERPIGYFPMMLTHSSTYPIRKDIIQKFGDKWTDPENIQTLGAYKLKIWSHDKAIVLERNEGYYGTKPKLKNVMGYMINEFSTALSLSDAGKLDFQQELPAKELPNLRTRPGYRETPGFETYFYGFNSRKAPFNDLRVRKAFVHAVDRKQITDLLAGGQTPLTGWFPVGLLGHERDVGLKYDPKLAAQLLDEAGYKDRSKFPRVTLAFNTNENHQRIAENVQAQIKKNLGVEVQIANEEWKVYLSRLHNDTPDIYRMGWLADFPDPSSFAELLLSDSENNHTGWKSKRYDELTSQASSNPDREKRRVLYEDLQKVLNEEEVPVLPVYSGVRHVMLSKRVKDFPLTALQRWEFKEVSLR